MFIPRGSAVYESLATTYVLVDALVVDLCEGGFSGVVEIVLRDTDANILMAEGNVVGVLEQRGVSGRTRDLNRRNYSKATVAELAARSRYERGRISVYSCSRDTALAVAGLAGAEQLYAQLSTEFADLEKMIHKLARERDRQWFIELAMADGTNALIHLKDDRCRLISSHRETGEHESESEGLSHNPTLAALLDACSRIGGTFDVYFRGVNEEVATVEVIAPTPPTSVAQVSPPAGPTESSAAVEGGAEPAATAAEPASPATEVGESNEAQPAVEAVEAKTAAAGPATASPASTEPDPIPPSPNELAEARLAALGRSAAAEEERVKPHAAGEPVWQPVLSDEPLGDLLSDELAEIPPAAAAHQEEPVAPPPEPERTEPEVAPVSAVPVQEPAVNASPQLAAAATETAPAPQPTAQPTQPAAPAPQPTAQPTQPAAPPASIPRHTTGLSAIRSELEAATDIRELNEAQIMDEVKRLLSEVARTIEESAKSIEQRDTFSIYLRAGQLKVADRFPFLDPFGAEFEYLSGEIAFVGSVAPWEFIEGLTEALHLAVEGVAQASAQGARIRGQIAEDLRNLLERNKGEFIEYGLDGSIEKIIGG
jgi:hypothetical protein